MVYSHFFDKFKYAFENTPDKTAFVTCDNRQISWREYFNYCCSFANGLESNEITTGETIAIMGFNHPYWSISAMGASLFGSAFTGIYPTNGPEEVEHNLNLTDTSVLVIENMKLLSQIELKRKLKLIIVYNEDTSLEKYQDIPLITMTSFLERYKKSTSVSPPQDHQTPLCYIFTSGTTGLSKAVTITHANVCYTSDKMCNIYQLRDERIVSYLPLSHIAASMLDIFCHFYHQGTVFFAKPDALKGTLKDTLVQAQPTMFFGVPRVWEKMYERMLATAKEKYRGCHGTILKSVIQYAKDKTKNVHLKFQNATSADLNERIVFNTLGKLFFGKIKNQLGFGECRYFMTGAAPISLDILEYFASIDIVINEFYGMSETTGVITASLPSDYKWGSVGKPLIGTVKIAEDGEVLYQSPCVFREYKDNISATRETITDDWLHTGDIGKMVDGYLYITGRKKELLITAGGENVAPVKIEEKIKHFGPAINHVVVVGDKQKYLTCLITLHLEENSNLLVNREVDPTVQDITSAIKSTPWMDYIQKSVDLYNANPVSKAQKIQKFTILDKDFTIQNNCLTPTMKIKRNKIYHLFDKEIKEMYSE